MKPKHSEDSATGIVKGESETKFKPDYRLDRAEKLMALGHCQEIAIAGVRERHGKNDSLATRLRVTSAGGGWQIVHI